MSVEVHRAVAPTGSTAPPAAFTASSDGTLGTLVVRFSPFSRFYLINSGFEGRFLERTVPGAFKRTIAERGQNIRIQFDHGNDARIGSLPLGMPKQIRELPDGPEMVVPLFDTSYVRDLLPALQAGALGASFRFIVAKGGDSWVAKPARSAHNPEGLPERTLRDLDVLEAGPVVFPANPAATAGVRADGAEWVTPVHLSPTVPLSQKVRAAMIIRGMDPYGPRARRRTLYDFL